MADFQQDEEFREFENKFSGSNSTHSIKNSPMMLCGINILSLGCSEQSVEEAKNRARDILSKTSNFPEDEIVKFLTDDNKSLYRQNQQAEQCLVELGIISKELESRMEVMNEAYKGMLSRLDETDKVLSMKTSQNELKENTRKIKSIQIEGLRVENGRIENQIKLFSNSLSNLETKKCTMQQKLNTSAIELITCDENTKKKSENNQTLKKEMEELENFALKDSQREKALMDEKSVLSSKLIETQAKLDNLRSEHQQSKTYLEALNEEMKSVNQSHESSYNMWNEILTQVRRIDANISDSGASIAHSKKVVMGKQALIGKLKLEESSIRGNNKSLELSLKALVRQIDKQREKISVLKSSNKAVSEEVDVLDIKLASAKMSKLAVVKKFKVLKLELKAKLKKLIDSKKKVQETENLIDQQNTKILSQEEIIDQLKKANKEIEIQKKEYELEEVKLRKRLKNKSSTLQKCLIQINDIQAEFSGTTTLLSSLKERLQKLDIENEKQQEHIYSSELQLFLLENKKAHIEGKRTRQEKKSLLEQIEYLEQKRKRQKDLHKDIKSQLENQEFECKKILSMLNEAESSFKEKENKLTELEKLTNDQSFQIKNEEKAKNEQLFTENDLEFEVNKKKEDLLGVIQLHSDLTNEKLQAYLTLKEIVFSNNEKLSAWKARLKLEEKTRHQIAKRLAKAKHYKKILSSKAIIVLQILKKGPNIEEDHREQKIQETLEELERQEIEIEKELKEDEEALKKLYSTEGRLRTCGFMSSTRLNFASKDDLQKQTMHETRLSSLKEDLDTNKSYIEELKKKVDQEKTHSLEALSQYKLLNEKKSEYIVQAAKLTKDLKSQKQVLQRAKTVYEKVYEQVINSFKAENVELMQRKLMLETIKINTELMPRTFMLVFEDEAEISQSFFQAAQSNGINLEKLIRRKYENFSICSENYLHSTTLSCTSRVLNRSNPKTEQSSLMGVTKRNPRSWTPHALSIVNLTFDT